MCIVKSMITFLLTVDCVSNHINKWHQVPKRKNFDFICICFEVTTQSRWSVTILMWSITSRHLTWRKNCDGFWLSGGKSFPTVFYMNDFEAIISSRRYTLAWGHAHFMPTLFEIGFRNTSGFTSSMNHWVVLAVQYD